MNVSAWSIRQPIPAVLLFVLLTVAGLLGFRAMKVQNMPDVELPVVTVSLVLPGAAPAQMETEVARKVETSVAAVQGIKNTSATVVDGAAVVVAEFRLEKNLQDAVADVRDAVARVRADLPAELREPVVAKLDLAAMPVLTYTVASSAMDEESLSWFVDDTLSRALRSVPGVGAVTRVGGVNREVRVELDPQRLMATGTTALGVSRQLRAVQQEAAGGRARLGGAEQAVRASAGVGSVEALAALDLALPDGRRVRLGDVSTVRDGVAEPRSAALLDGKPVVAFEISRTRGASETEVADGVQRRLAEIRARHPDVVFTPAFDFVEPVRQNFESSMLLLVEGALLAVLVVWFFLREWRSTLIAALALPLSAIPTFAAMHLFGFTLNGVTLLSLSLVVGILVDDAIVEIENIMRHLQMPASGAATAVAAAVGGQGEAPASAALPRKTPYQAAMEAADEIGLAVIATTFTLVAVFLPTAFMSGVVGRFFVQFGWTAAIAVAFSLVVARLLTPMMCAYLLRPAPPVERVPGWLGVYLRAAGWCLRHRAITLLGTAGFFVGVLSAVPLLSTGFLPPDDLPQTQVTLTLPPGSTLDQTKAMAERARRAIAGEPAIVRIYTAIGAGSAGSDAFAPQGLSDVRRATLTITLTPREQRRGNTKRMVEARLRDALADLPGVRVRVGLGASAERYLLVLSGDDPGVLQAHAAVVERELRGLPGIGGVVSSANVLRPELMARIDPVRAADLGVTTQAVAETLRVATAGDYDPALPKLNLAQRQVPVVVRLPDAAREDLALLERLPVPGARGPVPVGQVATLAIEAAPAQIDRRNRQRNVTFEVELNGLSLGQVEQKVLALPSLAQLPPGLSRAALGDAEAMQELFSGFALAMAAGVLCIYMVLVLLFRDFVQPGTILVALVLAVPGAFAALLVTRSDVSMPALIGLIMLMGIAAKNSILLIDYAIIARREHGLERLEAVLDACRKRARPVVMTTVAMGAGMLPAALGWGADPSFRAPMAIVVIGGLITSTVMSLLVVPVVYLLVEDLLAQWRRVSRRGAVRTA